MKSLFPTIYGFNKTSEAGQDTFAISVFLGGCNLRCPYCMNASLVRKSTNKITDIEEIKDYVIKNKVDKVVISGGEPTITNKDQLIDLIKEIKSWGCNVGMSTNGTNTGILVSVIGFLDYVAIDIKATKCEQYEEISFDKNLHKLSVLESVFLSLSKLVEEKNNRPTFDFEIRTTLFPPFINKLNIATIGTSIGKQNKWVLQQFRHSKNMLDKNCHDIKPYTENEVKEIMDIAKKYCDNVSLKYV